MTCSHIEHVVSSKLFQLPVVACVPHLARPAGLAKGYPELDTWHAVGKAFRDIFDRLDKVAWGKYKPHSIRGAVS